MKQLIVLPLVFIACSLLLVGCASGPTGPVYRDVKASGALTPPPNKGLVLVFWKYSFSEGGLSENANRTKVYANDQRLEPELRPGGFCSYTAQPGYVRISSGARTEKSTSEYAVATAVAGVAGLAYDIVAQSAAQKKDRASFEILPGQVYFLETHTGMIQESMKPVSKEEGEERIQDCHWLNPPAQFAH